MELTQKLAFDLWLPQKLHIKRWICTKFSRQETRLWWNRIIFGTVLEVRCSFAALVAVLWCHVTCLQAWCWSVTPTLKEEVFSRLCRQLLAVRPHDWCRSVTKTWPFSFGSDLGCRVDASLKPQTSLQQSCSSIPGEQLIVSGKVLHFQDLLPLSQLWKCFQ